MPVSSLGRPWVAAGACASILAAWWLELRLGPGRPQPRPVVELPRTTRVLDSDDCAYLAALYRQSSASWFQSYFNMLAHYWNERDERMGVIFRKVVAAANALPGGGGNYTITNDFFSFRAPGVVQFAPQGLFHMDCDFWKIDAFDGFNLWVLIDHSDLDTSFDIAERRRNPSLYSDYDGAGAAYLVPWNQSDPNSTYRRVQPPPLWFRSGHWDALNWRVALQEGFRRLLRFGLASVGRGLGSLGSFKVPAPAVTNVRLRVGEALVLREQELHRTDLHAELLPGQFRLAAGFKLQQRGATITAFDLRCTSQKDRLNIPQLWERVGQRLSDIYLEPPPPGSRLRPLTAAGRLSTLFAGNAVSLAALAAMATAAGPCLAGWTSTKGATLAAAGTASLMLLLVVGLQWDWLIHGASAPGAGEGLRRRSAALG